MFFFSKNNQEKEQINIEKQSLKYRRTTHAYHIVDPSPWPFTMALSLFLTTTGFVLYMHYYDRGFFLFTFSFLLVLFFSSIWWRDVVRESTFEGNHTETVRRGLRFGMILFILTEVMFFFSFFWAYFHSSLNPTPEIGSVWPPKGIEAIHPFHVPLLNTIVLLSSGATITWSHYSLISGFRRQAITSLAYTILLGIYFTFLQAFEIDDKTGEYIKIDAGNPKSKNGNYQKPIEINPENTILYFSLSTWLYNGIIV